MSKSLPKFKNLDKLATQLARKMSERNRERNRRAIERVLTVVKFDEGVMANSRGWVR